MLTSIKNRIVSRVDRLTSSGKVYIFLTPSGGYFSSLIFILFIISLSYANSLAYLCSFLFFAVVFVSCHVTNFNLYGLKLVRLKLQDFYFQDSEAVGILTVKNEGEKTRFDIEGSLLKSDSDYVLEINPGQSREILLNIPTKKVGLFPFKRVDIRTSFPFGIFRSWMPVKNPGEVLIIPSPVVAPMPEPELGIGDEEGIARFSQQREEFKEHQKYENQHVNKIDWKVYAKRGELYAKEYDCSLNPSYRFHFSRAENLGVLVHWIMTAKEQGARYELILKNGSYPMGSGREHFLNCLRAIAKEAK